jgi:hypothetical protein
MAVKVSVSRDIKTNAPLLAGALVGILAGPLSKLLGGDPISTTDWLAVFGGLSALLTGNLERKSFAPKKEEIQ